MRRFLIAGGVVSALLVQSAGAFAASSDTYRALNLFGDVFERVRSDYVEEVPDDQLIEYAINGMLASLDPHSSYMNAKNFADMQVQTKGEFGGLGIEVTMENGLVKVVSPIDDTPAAHAGLKPGDYITALDGSPVLGMTLAEAVDKMRGPVASKIVITIARQGIDNPFDVSLERAVIRIQSVRARREGDVVYVRITQFNEQTDENLRKQLDLLEGQIGSSKFQGVVLDLRNNPGGLLDQAVAVSDAFLTHGEVVSTRGRHPDDITRYTAKDKDVDTVYDRPLVVLINGGSASASEIVAGALQDHRRAVILGTRSFGKGSVQTIIPLDGQGALRLTTARYYTPSGRSIQARGIDPDIVVEQVVKKDAKGQPLHQGAVRSEADLPKHLQAEGTGDFGTPAHPEALEADEVPTAGAEDHQLAYALELLRGVPLNGGKASN